MYPIIRIMFYNDRGNNKSNERQSGQYISILINNNNTLVMPKISFYYTKIRFMVCQG